ncbi:MAG: cytochrome c family protein [Alteraurantiacibacter sp.]|nr:cytochrome c family protein [Alteraurantiacibacter sp.]
MTDRLNTILGWLLFAGVVALLLRFVVGLVMPETERPEKLGYVIEGVETGGAAEGPSLAALLNTGDAAAGANSFAKCMACHTIEQGGANGIGPNLWGVMGQPVGKHAAGFAYSEALSSHGGVWDFENMDAWLKSPRAFANGTKMSFAGLSDPQERANVILYLLQNGGGPALPPPPAAEEPATEGGAAPAEGEGEQAAAPAA